GQLARGEDRAVTQLRRIELSVQMLPGLAIADRAHRPQIRLQVAARTQGAYFVEKSLLEYRVHARGDARMQRRAIDRNEGELEHAIRKPRWSRALQLGQRLAGQRNDLERALDTLVIVRLDARSGGRVELAQ